MIRSLITLFILALCLTIIEPVHSARAWKSRSRTQAIDIKQAQNHNNNQSIEQPSRFQQLLDDEDDSSEHPKQTERSTDVHPNNLQGKQANSPTTNQKHRSAQQPTKQTISQSIKQSNKQPIIHKKQSLTDFNRSLDEADLATDQAVKQTRQSTKRFADQLDENFDDISFDQSTQQSHNRSINTPLKQPTNRTKAYTELIGLLNENSGNQSIKQSNKQSTNQTNQSVNQSIDRSVNQTASLIDRYNSILDQLSNQPDSQLTGGAHNNWSSQSTGVLGNHSIRQTINQTINQPRERPVDHRPMMGFSFGSVDCSVTQSIYESVSNQLINSGLVSAGYKAFIMSDCWQSVESNSSNNIASDQSTGLSVNRPSNLSDHRSINQTNTQLIDEQDDLPLVQSSRHSSEQSNQSSKQSSSRSIRQSSSRSLKSIDSRSNNDAFDQLMDDVLADTSNVQPIELSRKQPTIKQTIKQSTNQTVKPTLSQTINQSKSQTIKQPNDQASKQTRQSNQQSNRASKIQSNKQLPKSLFNQESRNSNNRSTNQSIRQTNNQTIKQSNITQSNKQIIKQSNNTQSANQTIEQSNIPQSNNQTIHQSVESSARKFDRSRFPDGMKPLIERLHQHHIVGIYQTVDRSLNPPRQSSPRPIDQIVEQFIDWNIDSIHLISKQTLDQKATRSIYQSVGQIIKQSNDQSEHQISIHCSIYPIYQSINQTITTIKEFDYFAIEMKLPARSNRFSRPRPEDRPVTSPADSSNTQLNLFGPPMCRSTLIVKRSCRSSDQLFDCLIDRLIDYFMTDGFNPDLGALIFRSIGQQSIDQDDLHRTEEITQFQLFCLLGVPLMLDDMSLKQTFDPSNNQTSYHLDLSSDQIALLTNQEAISISQSPVRIKATRVIQSNDQTVDQSKSRPYNTLPIDQTNKQSIKQSVKQSIKQSHVEIWQKPLPSILSFDRSVKQPTSRRRLLSSDQTHENETDQHLADQSINQSINQPIRHLLGMRSSPQRTAFQRPSRQQIPRSIIQQVKPDTFINRTSTLSNNQSNIEQSNKQSINQSRNNQTNVTLDTQISSSNHSNQSNRQSNKQSKFNSIKQTIDLSKKQNITLSFNQSSNSTNNQTINQTINQPVNQTIMEPIDLLAAWRKQQADDSVKHPIDQSNKQTSSLPFWQRRQNNQTIKQSNKQISTMSDPWSVAKNRSIEHPIKQSIKRSLKLSDKPSDHPLRAVIVINQSINQSIDQSINFIDIYGHEFYCNITFDRSINPTDSDSDLDSDPADDEYDDYQSIKQSNKQSNNRTMYQSIDWSTHRVHVRDAWNSCDLGLFDQSITLSIKPRGSRLLIFDVCPSM